MLKQQSTDSLLRRGRLRTVCLEEWHALEAARAELHSRLPAAEQLQGSLTQNASAVLGLICMHLRPLVATEPRLLERWASEIGALPQASLGGAAFMRLVGGQSRLLCLSHGDTSASVLCCRRSVAGSCRVSLPWHGETTCWSPPSAPAACWHTT